MRPIWYLDVDGVINMVRNRGSVPPGVPPECYRYVEVREMPISYDTRVVERINTWHRKGLVEMVWLTTWERDAPDYLAPVVGLDEFRCPTRSLSRAPEGPTGWWKFMSVLDHQAEDHLGERAVIWTDDDLAYSIKLDRGITDWHKARAEAGLATLGISPRPGYGLTMAQLDEIERVLIEAKQAAA